MASYVHVFAKTFLKGAQLASSLKPHFYSFSFVLMLCLRKVRLADVINNAFMNVIKSHHFLLQNSRTRIRKIIYSVDPSWAAACLGVINKESTVTNASTAHSLGIYSAAHRQRTTTPGTPPDAWVQLIADPRLRPVFSAIPVLQRSSSDETWAWILSISNLQTSSVPDFTFLNEFESLKE
jgi:hypothetical protein